MAFAKVVKDRDGQTRKQEARRPFCGNTNNQYINTIILEYKNTRNRLRIHVPRYVAPPIYMRCSRVC